MIAALLASLLPIVALLLLSLARAERARKLARQSSLAVKHDLPTEAGPVVLQGTVEPVTDSNEPVISLSVRQVGHEMRGRNGTTHVWRETSRALQARPFDLALSAGERVRVEPSRIALVDKLELYSRPEFTVRELAARIDRGETVTISGEMRPSGLGPGGGYRDARARLVLGAPRKGLMLISSEPLDARFETRARLAVLLAMIAGTALFAHGVIFRDAYFLLARGQVFEVPRSELAREVRNHRSRRGAHDTAHDFMVARIALPTGERVTLKDEVDPRFWGSSYGKVATTPLPFLVDPASPRRHAIGRFPHVGRGRAIVGVVLALGVWVLALVLQAFKRPWYERKRLIESGSGPLTNDVKQ